MKCFIHNSKEAVAACKKCGKGMCSNCSAYSGHTGICPECRKREFEATRATLYSKVNGLKWRVIGTTILLCLTFWTVIGGIYFGVKLYKNVKERNENDSKIAFLTKEIDKLNAALTRHSDAMI